MQRDKSLAYNTALLTASSLMMRFAGMVWQVWLVGRIGEAGIGLFQLILSVDSLAVTFAISGIRYTSTRLVSEELGADRPRGAGDALTRCLLYGAFFGLAAGLILLFSAEPLGFLWLGDARTVRPLMVLSLRLPLMALSSVMFGYFTATGRVWKSVCIQIGQQIFMMAVTAGFLHGCAVGDIEKACYSLTAGGTSAELIGFVGLGILFRYDRRRYGNTRTGSPEPNMTNRMLNIALPLAGAAYARSGLSTLQHLLVPVGLRSSGLTARDALAGYGIIQGMALPAVLFPSCVMLAVAELIVPKLTRSQVVGANEDIRTVTVDLLQKSMIFSVGTAALLLALGDSLGLALYDSAEAGLYIQIFALIVPVMYMDMVTDGCLKGLGQMMFCMYVNILDAGSSALLVWLTLPRGGLAAYIGVICFTEVFNFVLSIARLKKIAGFRLPSLSIIVTITSAALAASVARLLNMSINTGNKVPALIISALMGLGAYCLLLRLCLKKEQPDKVRQHSV